MARTVVCSAKKAESEAKHYGLAAAFVLTANGGGSDALSPGGVGSASWKAAFDESHEPWDSCTLYSGSLDTQGLCEILKYMVNNLGHGLAAKALQEGYNCFDDYTRCVKTALQVVPCPHPYVRSEEAVDFVQRWINLFLTSSANATAAITGSNVAATPIRLYQTVSNSPQADAFRKALNIYHEDHSLETETVAIAEAARNFAHYIFKAIVAAGGYIGVQTEEFTRALVTSDWEISHEYDVANNTCLSLSSEYPRGTGGAHSGDCKQELQLAENDPFYYALFPMMMALGMFCGVALLNLIEKCRRPTVNGPYQRLSTEDAPILDSETFHTNTSIWKKFTPLKTDSREPDEWP
eukprot:Protomagalhaensia_wolfi_Nauph_80__3427@NODE_347_length_2714_cov_229_338318_g261_i0_p2_GENE_NODE_347_length_2714_cov_229_338318_g261_i0NODE_347_length_2714_cov_229_338318_g261_i0_p2_ORF_typecomplete_len369_score50_62_NODE_347_length_2714_cov_229_338318_g261_i0551107